MTRTPTAIVLAALAGLTVAACGQGTKPQAEPQRQPSTPASSSAPLAPGAERLTLSAAARARDENAADRRYEQAVRHYGRPAGTAERTEISALMERYSAAAIAHDGAAACRMIYSPIAESVAEDYGQPPGPPYARGKTCAVVMSKLFLHTRHHLPVTPAAVMVRVKGNQGYAVLTYPHAATSYTPVRREGRHWRLTTLLIGR